MKYLCEIYVSDKVGHCPEKAAVVKYKNNVGRPGRRIRIIVCESHIDALPEWGSLLVPVYLGLFGLVPDEGITGVRIDPMGEFKYPEGSLKGAWRQSLQTLQFNVKGAAYLSTPGAPIRVAGKELRPCTEAEAAEFRGQFAALARELNLRDPDGYAAWEKAFLAWKAGDLSAEIPNPEAYGEES